ncbi:MAG TPA: hypothetical protein GX498_07250 [Clostridiales bacterium]|nr:hypothetical protein [Clostridiales bacterium]
MNTDKNDMEKILFQAKKDVDKFFSGFPYANLNKSVHCNLKNGRKPVSVNTINYKLSLKYSALGICILLLLIGGFYNYNEKSFRSDASMGEPISKQMLKFEDENIYQWLHFFKINKPYHKDNNLLAVIWNPINNGDFEMVYSSMFENSSKPLPVHIIGFPENKSSIIIISSIDDDEKYIHYRIISYKDNKLFTFVEQNYVIGGKIEVVDGAIKETRLVPKNLVGKNGEQDMRRIVTYFIPYQLDKYGNITLPLEELKINKGEHVAIIGDDSVPIEISDSKLLLDWNRDDSLVNINNDIKHLYACNSGNEYIYIKPLNGGMSKRIFINVMDGDEADKEN